MLWEAVVGGLKVLTFWQTYVAGILYLAIFFIPAIIFGQIMERDPAKISLGCVSMLVIPILQVAAMITFVLILSPIILGFAEDAAWSLPWRLVTVSPGSFAKLVAIVTVASFALAFMPFLGRLHSLHTLVGGGIVLAFALSLFDVASPGMLARVSFIPNFWLIVALLLIGGILSWIGMMFAGLIAAAFSWKDEGLGIMIGFPIAAVFGFVPMFMYGAWLGAQVRGYF